MAMHHQIHHSVLFQILRLLETFRQFFPDGLLDHARAGKTDERARFGDVNVAQHGIGSGDAAGGWIGEHDDVGLACGTQILHRYGCAGHLHERQNAFLHARPSGRRKQDERRAFLRSRLQSLDDCLTGLHAERAAHKVEILHRDDNRKAVELAKAKLECVFQTRLGARVAQPVGIAPLVPELQRIGCDLRYPDVDPGLSVEHRFEARRCAHAHVIVGNRNDELVRLDVFVKHELPRVGAFDPQILRHLAPVEKATDLWPDDVGDPVHEVYSAACCRALRTPAASSVTSSWTDATVAAVALPAASRLVRTFSTRAEPTTTASASRAITAALAASRTPKPTATGRIVWRLIRLTASATRSASGAAAPVMPVIET